MQIVQNILYLLIALGVLIFVHEGGHYILARMKGVYVEIFSLGFGPRLFGFKKNGTDYRLSAIPLGGYVKMYGEEPWEEASEEDASSDEEPAELESEKPPVSPESTEPPPDPSTSFQAKTRWQRSQILLAGPLTNVLIAYLFIVTVYMIGLPELQFRNEAAILGYVGIESPAAVAKLRDGDEITMLGGKTIKTWEDLRLKIALNPDQTLPMTWLRRGSTMRGEITLSSDERYRAGKAGIEPRIPFAVADLESGSAAEAAGLKPGDEIVEIDKRIIYSPTRGSEVIASYEPGSKVILKILRDGVFQNIPLELGEREGKGYMGITIAPPPTFTRQYGLKAFGKGFGWMKKNTELLFITVGKLLTGKLSLRSMSGPVDIAKFSGATARSGLMPFLSFMAYISLQLGIINLFPIPVLDGGHLFIIGFEGLWRQDLSLKTKERFMTVGFLFIITLMGAIIALDIIKNISW